ncbi:hypothetical protein MARPO_0052s0013 [Marchantia polymorpha]|nr:hypothetical protein MARPO_0052s0013 [Marchantia polymorpha]|eukprot:PTQ38209.1 hypothetical protein MARPO_0052s0013 [Marchantia polymorpha]
MIQQNCCKDTFWMYIGAIVGLLAFSGLMSGLTLGLMSLGLVDLEVLRRSGKPDDRRHAAKILPVVRNQHLLLVTLLVGNAMAMEALPLFLDSVVDTYVAIILSVTLLLMFGEILPQAVCSRYGLAVGAAVAPLVRVLLFVMFPVAFPLSKMLDWMLGEKHALLFGRAELRTLVDMHSHAAGNGGQLSRSETSIISGALQLGEKTAGHAMTPLGRTFSVDLHSRLDRAALARILASGHSRVPVFAGAPSNLVGLVLVKSLLCVDRPRDDVPVAALAIRPIPRVAEATPLYDLLHEFLQGRSHMAAVVRPVAAPARHHVVAFDHVPQKLSPSEGPQQGPVPSPAGEDARQQREHSHHAPATGLANGSVPRRVQPWPSWAEEDGEVVGIITLEDVLEEILQEEIWDEKDRSAGELCATGIPEDRPWTQKPVPGQASEQPSTPKDRGPMPMPAYRYSISAPGSPKRNATASAPDQQQQPPKRVSAASAPGSPTHHVRVAAGAQRSGSSAPVSPNVVYVASRGSACVRLGNRASVAAVNEPPVAINSRIHMHRVLFTSSNAPSNPSRELERPKTAPGNM